jgi:hypothetical protein
MALQQLEHFNPSVSLPKMPPNAQVELRIARTTFVETSRNTSFGHRLLLLKPVRIFVISLGQD